MRLDTAATDGTLWKISETSKVADGDFKIDRSCRRPNFKHDRKLPSIVNSRIAKFEKMTTQPRAAGITATRDEVRRQNRTVMPNQDHSNIPSELRNIKTKYSDLKTVDNSVRNITTKAGFSTAQTPLTARHGRLRNHVQDKISATPMLIPSRFEHGLAASTIIRSSHIEASQMEKKAACPVDTTEPKIISVAGHQWSNVRGAPLNTGKENIKPHSIKTKTINSKLATYLARVGSFSDSPEQAMSVIPRGKSERMSGREPSKTTIKASGAEKLRGEKTTYAKSQLAEFCDKIAVENSLMDMKQGPSQSHSEMKLTTEQTKVLLPQSRTSEHLSFKLEDSSQMGWKNLDWDHTRSSVELCSNETTVELDQDVLLSCESFVSRQENFSAQKSSQKSRFVKLPSLDDNNVLQNELSAPCKPQSSESSSPEKVESKYLAKHDLTVLKASIASPVIGIEGIIACDMEEKSLTHSSPLQSDTHELNQTISDCDGRRLNSTAETSHSLIDAPLQLTSSFDEPSLWETGTSLEQAPILQSGRVQETEQSKYSIAAPPINKSNMPIVDMAEVDTLQEPTAVENVVASTTIQSSCKIDGNSHKITSTANGQIPSYGLVLSKLNPVVQAPTASEIEVRKKVQSPMYTGKSLPSSKQSSCNHTVNDRGAEITFDSLNGLDATFEYESFDESSTLTSELSKKLTENEGTACERPSNVCIPSDGDTGHLQNKSSEMNRTERCRSIETSLVLEATTIPESLLPIHSKRPTPSETPTVPETSRASGTSSASNAPTILKPLSAFNLSILSKTPTFSQPSSTSNTPRALETSSASSAPTQVLIPTALDVPIPTGISICLDTSATTNTKRAPPAIPIPKSPTFSETSSPSTISRASDTPTISDSPILSQITSCSETPPTSNTSRVLATTTSSKSPTVPGLPILLDAPTLSETPTVYDLPIPTRTPTLSETTTPTYTSRASDTPTSVLIRDIPAESESALCSDRSEAQTGASSDQATDSFHSCSSHSTPTSYIADVYNESILSEVEQLSLPTTPNTTSSFDASSAWKTLSTFSTKYGSKGDHCNLSTPRISFPSILTALRHSSNSYVCSEGSLESPSSTKSIYSGPQTPGTTRSRELNLDTEEDGMLMDCLDSFHSCSSPTTSVAALLTPVERSELPLTDTENLSDLLRISCQTARDLADEKSNAMKGWTSKVEHIVIDNATSPPAASTDHCCLSNLTMKDTFGCAPVKVPSSASENSDHSTSKERISSSTSLPTPDDRGPPTSNKPSTSSELISTSTGIAFESTVKVQRNNLWRWYFSKENSDQNLLGESQKNIISAGKCHRESDKSSLLSTLAKRDNDAASDQDEEFNPESTLSQYRKSSFIKTPNLPPTTPATPESLPTTPQSDHSGEENRSSRNTDSVGNSPDTSNASTEGLKDNLNIGMQALKTIFQMNSTTKANRSSNRSFSTTILSSLSDCEEQSITAGCKVYTKYGLGTVVACNLRSEVFVIVKLQAGSMPLMMYCRTAQNMHVIPALRHEWVTTPSGEGCVIDYMATERKYLIELAVDPTNERAKSKNEQLFAEKDIFRHARVKRIPSFLTSASSSQSWKNSSTISCSSRGSSAHPSPLGSNGDTDSSTESIKPSSTGLFANALRRAMTTSTEISSSTMQYVSTRNSVGQFVVTPYGHGTITDLDHAKEVAIVKMAHTNETRGVDIHAIKYVLKALVGMTVQTSKFGSGTVVAIRPENAIYTVKLTKSWAHPNQDRVIYVHENDLKKASRYSTGLQYSTFKLWG